VIRNCSQNVFILILGLLLTTCLAQSRPRPSWASPDHPDKSLLSTSAEDRISSKPWYRKIEGAWGGHVKLRGGVSWPDEESFYAFLGTDPYYDGFTELRFTSELFLGGWGYFETHYEAILSGGDTRRKWGKLGRLPPGLSLGAFFLSRPLEDERRLMDLTSTVDEDDGYIFYHRLDRLSLTLLPEWGVIRIGRQAVTWGNGLIFNPMDLFNPFAPTDIERDYKVGDDMVSAQFPVNEMGDVQLLYVARRNPANGNVNWDQSSLTGKVHFAVNTTEFDIMGARHYADYVVGVGGAGYIKDAAWRLDTTWTFLNGRSGMGGFLSLVANIDYSWVWWKKNVYGLIELYYNGVGEDHYEDALTDEDVLDRLERGELFVLGRTYVSGHIRLEAHPLFNVFFTVINNMADPSGILQPRAIWDIGEDIQITLGGSIVYGGNDTEYGGFEIPGTDFLIKAPDRAFLWVNYFF
jgi:hypothetical protein